MCNIKFVTKQVSRPYRTTGTIRDAHIFRTYNVTSILQAPGDFRTEDSQISGAITTGARDVLHLLVKTEKWASFCNWKLKFKECLLKTAIKCCSFFMQFSKNTKSVRYVNTLITFMCSKTVDSCTSLGNSLLYVRRKFVTGSFFTVILKKNSGPLGWGEHASRL